MFSTRSRVSRTAAVTFALAGALGLSACQESGPDAAPPTSPTSEAEATSAPEETAEETTEESPETSEESPETSESSSSETSESSESSGAPSDVKLTPAGTTLKVGDEGVINEGSESEPEPIGVTPTAVEKAPDSVFNESSSLKKSNGAVYFLKHDVRNVTSEPISASDINGLFFHPKLNASNNGKAKRLYGSVDGCETNRDEIAPGKKVSSCTVYQIGGDPVSGDVVYSRASGTITWAK